MSDDELRDLYVEHFTRLGYSSEWLRKVWEDLSEDARELYAHVLQRRYRHDS